MGGADGTRRAAGPPRLTAPFAVAASAGTVVVLLGGLVTKAVHVYVTPVSSWVVALDVARESNVPTWWNASLLLAVGAAAALLALLAGPGDHHVRRGLWTVAALATAMSLDETVRLHERLGAPGAALAESVGVTLPTYAWVLPGLLVTVPVGVLALWWLRRLVPVVAGGIVLALAAYATGALGLEAVSGAVERRLGIGWGYWLVTTVEEGLEMVACIIAASVLLSRLVVVEGTEGRALRSLPTARTDALDAAAGAHLPGGARNG